MRACQRRQPEHVQRHMDTQRPMKELQNNLKHLDRWDHSMETYRFRQTLVHSPPTAHVSHPSGSLSRAGGETGAGSLVGAELVERPGGASGICSLVLLSLFQSFPRHRVPTTAMGRLVQSRAQACRPTPAPERLPATPAGCSLFWGDSDRQGAFTGC